MLMVLPVPRVMLPSQHLPLVDLLVEFKVNDLCLEGWTTTTSAPTRRQKLLQQGRKDFVPGGDLFFQVPCCSPKERRKAALPEGCLAALHRCQGVCKPSAQGICSSTRQSHLSIHQQDTREKYPEHTSGRQTSSQNPPAKRLSSNTWCS